MTPKQKILTVVFGVLILILTSELVYYLVTKNFKPNQKSPVDDNKVQIISSPTPKAYGRSHNIEKISNSTNLIDFAGNAGLLTSATSNTTIEGTVLERKLNTSDDSRYFSVYLHSEETGNNGSLTFTREEIERASFFSSVDNTFTSSNIDAIQAGVYLTIKISENYLDFAPYPQLLQFDIR